MIISVCQAASSDTNITVSELSVTLDDAQSSDSIAFKRSDSSVISQEIDGEVSAASSSSQMIEQFERTTEEQDAQDRIDQLLLEDELSDARIAEQGSKEQHSASISELLEQNSTTSVKQSVSSSEQSVSSSSSKTGSSQFISVSTSQKLVESCQDLLHGCCELTHMRCAKVLNVRAKVGVSCVCCGGMGNYTMQVINCDCNY